MFYYNDGTGVGSAAAGPNKNLGSDTLTAAARTDLTYLRDTTTAGGKTLPFPRDAYGSANSDFKVWTIGGAETNAGGVNGWKWTPAATDASLSAFDTNNNSVAGAVHLWWAKAKVLSTAINTWWTTLTDNTTKIQGSTKANVATTTDGGNGPCDTTGWTAVTADSDEVDSSACLAACRAVNTALIGEGATDWFEPNANANGTTDKAANSNLGVDAADSNSVLRMARWSSGSKVAYCGAYSFSDSAAADSKCFHLLSSTSATGTANDEGASQCETLTDVGTLGEAQGAIRTAWQDGLDSSTLYDNMATAIDT